MIMNAKTSNEALYGIMATLAASGVVVAAEDPKKRRKLNGNGLKDSCDMWRTYNGEHYGAWLICPSEARVKAYRAAGIKCRRIKDELFVRDDDLDIAREIDVEMGDS